MIAEQKLPNLQSFIGVVRSLEHIKLIKVYSRGDCRVTRIKNKNYMVPWAYDKATAYDHKQKAIYSFEWSRRVGQGIGDNNLELKKLIEAHGYPVTDGEWDAEEIEKMNFNPSSEE